MARWQLQDAKARFSEVVRSSQEAGPQEITVHGKPTAVVLSKADYDRLKGVRPSFVTFLRRSPLAGLRLKIDRDRSAARDPHL